MSKTAMFIGSWYKVGSRDRPKRYLLPTHHLTTHGVVVGASGTGKTGGLIVMLEEAVRADIPLLVIDVKGDMANLGLVFSDFSGESFLPWIQKSPGEKRSAEEVAEALAKERRDALQAWGLGLSEVEEFTRKADLRVILRATPRASRCTCFRHWSIRATVGRRTATEREPPSRRLSRCCSV